MIEIEILVELNSSIEDAKTVLNGYQYQGSKKTIDYYYYDPLRSNLALNENNKLLECCRLREKSGKYFVTYKIDRYDNDTWLYSDEFETSISDIDTHKKILESLGLLPLVTIDNVKHTYNTDKYEIVLEEVKDLGNFLEVEYIGNENNSAEAIKKDIKTFINELGIDVGEELNSGKPELLLIKSKGIK